jgi:hypothetical protein
MLTPYFKNALTYKNIYLMANLKDLSGNELSELIVLYGRIDNDISRDFIHVSGYMPERLKRDIKNAQLDALKEYERRYMDEN